MSSVSTSTPSLVSPATTTSISSSAAPASPSSTSTNSENKKGRAKCEDDLGKVMRIEDPSSCERPCKRVEDSRSLVIMSTTRMCIVDELLHYPCSQKGVCQNFGTPPFSLLYSSFFKKTVFSANNHLFAIVDIEARSRIRNTLASDSIIVSVTRVLALNTHITDSCRDIT